MAAITGAAAGHPSIRATHRKTLELTRDESITERATCVVGVAAQLPEEELAALHGRVALTLSAGAESVELRGRLNPAFRPGDPLVVRRAPDVARNALIVSADLVAADVPRSFVTAAADAGARIAVRVEELGDAEGVLIVAPATLSQYDHRIGGLSATAAVAAGERVTIAADLASDAEARTAIAAAHEAGHTVLPHPSLSLSDAVLAVAGVAEAPVETVPAERVPKLIRKANATRGVIGLDLGTPREQYMPWRAGERVEIPGARGRRATLVLVQD
jgi:hypothetical protein